MVAGWLKEIQSIKRNKTIITKSNKVKDYFKTVKLCEGRD